MLSQCSLLRFGSVTVTKGGNKKTLNFEDESTLFTVLSEAGLMETEGTCSGNRACGKCFCKHTGGKVAEADEEEKEFLDGQPAGTRLACFITLTGENNGATFEV